MEVEVSTEVEEAAIINITSKLEEGKIMQKQNGRDHDHHQPHQNGVHDHQHQQGKQSGGKQIPRPKKNTENFNPSHEAPPMR